MPNKQQDVMEILNNFPQGSTTEELKELLDAYYLNEFMDILGEETIEDSKEMIVPCFSCKARNKVLYLSETNRLRQAAKVKFGRDENE